MTSCVGIFAGSDTPIVEDCCLDFSFKDYPPSSHHPRRCQIAPSGLESMWSIKEIKRFSLP